MNRRTGQEQEQHVERYLRDEGLTLVERNYFCPRGEIDLIMRDRDVLVFVEVRLRRHRQFASGLESVDWRKQQKLITTAQHFLQRHPKLGKQPCRFDVVACDGTDFTWIKNAFES